MDSSKSSMVIPFKSKKSSLTTTPIKKENNQVFLGPAVSTPEKAILNPVNRIRNRNFALSISDIRRSALQLQKSNLTGSDSQNVVSKKSFNNVIGQKSKGSDKSANVLPEKYEMLCDFFVAMVNSIRLLRLKSVPGSFNKLAHKIESLTDRRFTLRHLAQLKYIVPEVIVAKKILVQDEKTKCMEEELLVSLDMGAVENDTNAIGGDGFAKLKRMFRSRITDYSKTHLEVDDIPEGELPHLFKQPKKEVEPIMNTIPTPMAASLTAPSFKRRFSSRSLRDPVVESMPAKPSSCLSEIPNKEVTCADDTDGPSCSTVEADATPLNPVSTPAKLASIPTKLASTPAELASTPARLMAATPELRTRKRPPMTPDHDSNDFTTSLKRSKSLKFDDSSVDNEDHLSQVDEEESIAPAQDSTITKDDVLEILPDGLLQSLMEKERKIIEEKDPVVVNAKRRQQMMTRVPRLFDMIRLLFQSIRRSVITKEELIYKLLAGNFEIVDRTEVEEQLQLLQEVAPEFISEKQSISGDTLLSLNKCSSPDSIRAKLLEAK